MSYRVQSAAQWAAIFGFLATSGAAHAQEHAHGVAKLSIAVEGAGFTVQLESPLDNLVGFEHAPRNKQQEQAVRAMADKLRGAGALFKPNSEAQCRLGKSELASSALPPALIGKAGAKAAPKETGKPSAKAEHADLDASFEFACARPEALKSLNLASMFSGFTGLRRIEVQLVTQKRQLKRTLTRTSATLAW